MTFKKWLTEFLQIKKIIALTLTCVFCYLSIKSVGASKETQFITSDQFFTIFSMIIAFYFGQSTARDAAGTNKQILVKGISLTASFANSAVNSLELNKSLQINAIISPANAADKTVTWSVTNGTGKATITPDGVLTGTGAGTVIVTAAANDGSGIKGSIEVIIT